MSELLAFLEFGFIALFVVLLLNAFINFFFGRSITNQTSCDGPHKWEYNDSGTDLVCKQCNNSFSKLMKD